MSTSSVSLCVQSFSPLFVVNYVSSDKDDQAAFCITAISLDIYTHNDDMVKIYFLSFYKAHANTYLVIDLSNQ